MKIVKTKTSDGLHFTGFLSEPVQRTGKIVIHIHGSSGDPYMNEWYPSFHELYPQQGYAFLVGQLRGTGTMTQFQQDQNDKLPTLGNALEIFEESVLDIDAWVNYARSLGYREIVLQAHSFGPSKAVYYLNHEPENDIKAAVLISPVDMLGLTIANNNHAAMLAEAEQLVRQGKPKQLLSTLLDGDTYISAQTYVNLFSDTSEANVFCYTDRPHNWKTVNNLKLPVLLIGGTDDGPMEEVKNTTEAFKILEAHLQNSPQVDWKIFIAADHSFAGFENDIVQTVIDFLDKS